MGEVTQLVAREVRVRVRVRLRARVRIGISTGGAAAHTPRW